MALYALSSHIFSSHAPVLRASLCSTGSFLLRGYASSTKKFTPDHEWVSLKENEATVGITHHAQASLGDVVFVELPTLNKAVEKSETIGTVESVKAASDIYAPVSGDIIEVNESLKDKTFLINESPEDEGWICKIKISKASEIDELLDEEAYKKIIEPTVD